MGFFSNIFSTKPTVEPVEDMALVYGYSNVWSISHFDGEKNFGEMGPPRKFLIDHAALRQRSWEAYGKSDITQMIVGKHISWMVAAGLKLQLEPAKLVLENMGFTIQDDKKFVRMVEEAFALYAKSPESSFSNRTNLHLEMREAKKNAIIGGDCLVVFHIKNRGPKIQLIDGEHIQTPFFNNAFHVNAESRGNIIVDGIELDPKTKEHIAFFVRNRDFSFTRIPAKGARSGRTVATLYCGFKFRIDDQRGIPLLAAVLQTLKVLDRYKEATVASAEERAKIAFAIEHGKDSDGKNPMANFVKRSVGSQVTTTEDTQNLGEKLAKLIAKTTQKTAYNLPPDSKLNKLSDDVDLNFADFFAANIDLVSATMQTPPAVATSKYDTSYSASRAALKDWEHVIKIDRSDQAFFIYSPFFVLWFQMEVINNRIDAPEFLKAIINKDTRFMNAFLNNRFIGPNIPHIDPNKEAKAEREKLGPLGKNLPLTTAEKATENLNEGDYWANNEKFKEEVESVEELEEPVEA